MLCENCKQNQATVHLQKIINGEKIENHFCTECAQIIDENLSFESLFQGFLNSFFSQQIGDISGEHEIRRVLKCPNCSMTYTDFKNAGRLGCHQCYTTFRNELNFILKSIQTSNTHRGKLPKKTGASLILKRDLENLKTQLKHAVQIEKYEEAARLRDEIKKLGGEKNE